MNADVTGRLLSKDLFTSSGMHSRNRAGSGKGCNTQRTAEFLLSVAIYEHAGKTGTTHSLS